MIGSPFFLAKGAVKNGVWRQGVLIYPTRFFFKKKGIGGGGEMSCKKYQGGALYQSNSKQIHTPGLSFRPPIYCNSTPPPPPNPPLHMKSQRNSLSLNPISPLSSSTTPLPPPKKKKKKKPSALLLSPNYDIYVCNTFSRSTTLA